MTQKYVPTHPAALYFNELAPYDGENCALFGHFYHPPAPDALLTRLVAALRAGTWTVINDIDVNDIVSGGAAYMEGGKRFLLAVFRFGEAYVYHRLQRTAVPLPRTIGFISGVKRIGQNIYVCGSQNTVLKFNGVSWSDISGNIRVPYSGPGDPILNAIDGFSEEDVYAVGYEGAIFRYDGAQWTRLASPTNHHLHQVLCHSDGRVYLCGRRGVFLRGRPDAWEDLTLTGHEEDFWGLAAFRKEVYACSYRRLFRVAGSQLADEVVAVNSAGTFYRLASNESYMWTTTGTGHVLRFDGQTWIEMIWPDSK